MSSIKCKHCGLSNFAYEESCRRCGERFPLKSKSRKPSRFSLSSLIMIAFVSGSAYYVYYGLQKSADDVYASETKRVEEQKRDKFAGLSRTEYDRKRVGAYGNALQNNNSFAAHDRHIQETQKAMEAVSNAQQGKQ